MFVWESDEQLINHNFTMLGSKLHSINLRDVAGLEDAFNWLTFNFTYNCLNICSLNGVYPDKFTDKCM